MKFIYQSTLLLVLCFLAQFSNAQAPQKMTYQAVIRNASNALITNTSVGMRLSILKGSASGTSVYTETQTTTTNANGIITIEVGAGTVVSGNISAINWAQGPYFIKTETDPTGGTNYTITGTSQFLSVPYAFYAKTADSVANAPTLAKVLANGNSANSLKIANVSDPTLNQDAATKKYVDDKVATIQNGNSSLGKNIGIITTSGNASAWNSNNSTWYSVSMGGNGKKVVESNGNIAAATDAGNAAAWNSSTNSWVTISLGGNYDSIAGSNGNFVFSTSSGNAAVWNKQTNTWTSISLGGNGYAIAGSNGNFVFATTTGNAAAYNNLTSIWTTISLGGNAKKITASNGNFGFITTSGNAASWNSTTSTWTSTSLGGNGLDIAGSTEP
ncbi:MAG: hypothetical protein U0U67_11530 [Chitinophagales bacterium]